MGLGHLDAGPGPRCSTNNYLGTFGSAETFGSTANSGTFGSAGHLGTFGSTANYSGTFGRTSGYFWRPPMGIPVHRREDLGKRLGGKLPRS